MASTKMQRLDLPRLSGDLTASSVKTWIDGCEDAFEVHTLMFPEPEIKPALRILLAGLRMESPEAAQWWNENREALKALTTWADFVAKVKDRFIPSGWKMDALSTFYAIRQDQRPFLEFVASLQSARGILGTAGSVYKVSDSTFKHHLLLFCHPLLSLRVRAIPNLGYDTLKVDSLINLMASTWTSMIAEGVTRQHSTASGVGRPGGSSTSLPPLSDSEKSALKASGGCFHCRKTPSSPGWTAHTSKTCPGDPSRNIAPRVAKSADVAAVVGEVAAVAAVDSHYDSDVEFVPSEDYWKMRLVDYEYDSSDDEDSD